MMKHKLAAWIAIVSCFLAAPVSAQGTRSDYERANMLRQRTAGKVFKARVQPHWDAAGTGFWYRNDLAGGKREFIRVHALHGVRERAFDQRKLAEALAKATGKEVAPERLPIDNLAFSDAARMFRFDAAGKRWECNFLTYELREAGKDKPVVRSIPVLDAPRPTQRDGDETDVTFTNRMRETVELFWIDH